MCYDCAGGRTVSGMRTWGSVLGGKTGRYPYYISQHVANIGIRSRQQMRSADEGSTILYTVRGLLDRVRIGTCVAEAKTFFFVGADQCVSCKHGWRLNN